MVPDISVSRRRALAGVATALVGGGIAAPRYLPDPVTDLAVAAYPDPPNRIWWPTVTDEHVEEAVQALVDAIARAERLWDGVDHSVDRSLGSRTGIDSARRRLENARGEGNNRKALSDAKSGLQSAGYAIGGARIERDEADPEFLVEEGERIRTESSEVADSVDDYSVADPARDLGWLYHVERELSLARLDSYQGGTYVSGFSPTDDYDDHDVVFTWGSHLQAEQRLRTARRYRTGYRSKLTDGGGPHDDAVTAALSSLTEEIDGYPTREEVRGQFEEDEEETPYRVARWTLWLLCYDNDFRHDERNFRSDLHLLRAVRLARALLRRRAHAFALDRLAVSPDDSDLDSGLVLREKRRAMERYRAVRDANDSPIAAVLAQDAADLIRAGHLGLGLRGRDDTPAWRDRVEAHVYYLVARGQLRHVSDAVGRLVGEN